MEQDTEKFNPMRFLRTFTERFKSKIVREKYRVRYLITFDGDVLDKFDLVITAKSQDHAWEQVKRFIVVKPLKVERVK